MAKPEIRLKGFEGEWKDELLSKIATMHARIGWQNLRKDEFLSKGEYYLITGTDFFEGHVDYKTCHFVEKERYDQDKNIQIKNGSILITKDGTLGKVAFVENLNKPATLNAGVFNVVCIKNDVDRRYLFQYLRSPLLMDYVNLTATGGTIKHLNQNILVNFPVQLPAIEEQVFLGTYFQHLDNIVYNTTKKIASLKQMKSASLISMFPQTGETKPRVRFKGFEGEWKNDKAENLFKTFNERNRPDLPVLSANQDIRGMAPRSDTGYSISHNKANEVTYKVVKPGQYVIHLRSFQGGFAHSAVEGITSPAYTVFGFKDENMHDDYFWKIIFMSKEFIKSLETITYGIRDGRSISFDEFSEMKFLFPSKDEQQRIASYFRSLDKQISLQEQRLEKLKQIKAACLDKMFV